MQIIFSNLFSNASVLIFTGGIKSNCKVTNFKGCSGLNDSSLRQHFGQSIQQIGLSIELITATIILLSDNGSGCILWRLLFSEFLGYFHPSIRCRDIICPILLPTIDIFLACPSRVRKEIIASALVPAQVGIKIIC